MNIKQLDNKLDMKITLKDENKNCILRSDEKTVSQSAVNDVIEKVVGTRNSTRIGQDAMNYFASRIQGNANVILPDLGPFNANGATPIENMPTEEKWSFLTKTHG